MKRPTDAALDLHSCMRAGQYGSRRAKCSPGSFATEAQHFAIEGGAIARARPPTEKQITTGSRHTRQRPRRFYMATPLGFEPRITPPKGNVLLGRSGSIATSLLFLRLKPVSP